MSEWGPIVAGPIKTRFGAKKCPGCGRPISKGVAVVKVAAPGRTTQFNQGPGRWMHESCGLRFAASPPPVKGEAAQSALFDEST